MAAPHHPPVRNGSVAQRPSRAAVLPLLLVLLIAGSLAFPARVGAVTGPPPPPSSAEACGALGALTVPPARIGLPTTGATVTSTQLVANAGPTSPGEYCKVLVAIHPVDPVAPHINVQVDLPSRWNGKAILFGGGGFDGVIRDPAGNVPVGPTDRPTPLGQGYVTYNSDSGHQAAPPYSGTYATVDGRFALNDEALANFAGDFIKKSRDVADAVVDARYGRSPRTNYVIGGSMGGREALVAIARWPKDWDGAIASYPAVDFGALERFFGRLARALAQPGAYVNATERLLVFDATTVACDGLDGATDGVVSDPRACTFDLATLRCPGGADTGDDCLSEPQLAVYAAYGSPTEDVAGLRGYPGFDLLAGTDTAGYNAYTNLIGWNAVPPQHPPVFEMPYAALSWDQWVRYFVTRDPAANALAFDPANPGPYRDRLARLDAMFAVEPDLSAFARRGGRLILVHGLADQLVSPRGTEAFHAALRTAMGERLAERSVRFYGIPGYQHNSGRAFIASWDSLGALEGWVERRVEPRNLVVADAAPATAGRTRPLCEHPALPVYVGGDADVAASFACRP